MRCPVDQTVLQMSERSGVEIDYCPTCRGVWLDRGELDKILDRAAVELPAAGPDPRTESAGYPPPPPAYGGGYPDGGRAGGYDPRYSGSGHDPRYGRKRKKKSFLDELFD